jgi:hypothetical protein
MDAGRTTIKDQAEVILKAVTEGMAEDIPF